MMARKTEVPEELELLASLPVGVSTPHEIDEESARLVPLLESRIAEFPAARARAVRGRRRGLALAVTAAAAALVVGWFVRGGEGETASPRAELPLPRVSAPGIERGATLLRGKLASGSVEVLSGSRLGLARGLATGDEEGAVLRADEGYELSLEARSAVRLLPGAVGRTELSLSAGAVELAVPKLADGESLEVLTEDARVIVHGTKFRVALVEDDGERRRACVSVTEGRVEVRRNGASPVFLGPGERSGCDRAESASRVEERRPPARAERVRPSTTLAEENALMTKALAAERANQRDVAEAHYRQLLTRYPRSQFLPEARAGLARVRATP